MASYNKFNCLVADLANKVHNLSSDQITLALSDTLPVATNTVLANITQIAYTNLSSRNVTTVSSTQTSGLYKFILSDLVLTSSSGSVAQFRYVVVYNSTASGGPLIGWYDIGSEINLNGANGDTYTIDLDQTNGLFQLT